MANPPNPQFLPDIPFDIPESLQNLLIEMKLALENLTVDPGPPSQPTGLTLTRAYPGIVVAWNRTLKAARYIVFRNTTSSFATAQIVHVLVNIDNTSVLDITQDEAVDAVLFYWVVAENAFGTRGPISAMKSTGNSTAPPIIIGGLTNETDFIFTHIQAEGDEFNDTLSLAGSYLGPTSVLIWDYTEGDEDYWITPFTTDYRIF